MTLPTAMGSRERHEFAAAFVAAAHLELQEEDVEETVANVMRAASMLWAFVDDHPDDR